MNAVITKTVKVASVVPDPDQPRKTFDASKLAELADSIKVNGLLQPIAVRIVSAKPVRYQIVTGERRWRAHQIAGLDKITVQLAPARRDQLIAQIVENDQRDAMTPLDRARAYRRCLEEGLASTPGELAAKLGLRQPFRVNEALSLLKLCPEAQDMMDSEELAPSQAYYLTPLSAGQQIEVLDQLRAGKLKTLELFKAACTNAQCPKEKPDDGALLIDVLMRSKALLKALDVTASAGELVGKLLADEHLEGLPLQDAEELGAQLRMLAKAVKDLVSKVETSACPV